MVRFGVLLLTAYLLSIFQSAVMSEIFPDFLKPDLMLIFITYLGTSPYLVTGATVALGGGLFSDTFSGSPFGFFFMVYLIIFFLLQLLGKVLILGESMVARVSLVALAMVFQLGALIFFPWVFGSLEDFSYPGGHWILSQAASTCAASWPFFYLFLKIFSTLPGFALPQPMA
jgi:rod shape-determining protein MreD